MRFWPNVESLLARRQVAGRVLAAAIGLTPPAISRYRAGAVPGLEVAVRIAEYFRVSLDWLVWGEEGSSPHHVCTAPEEHDVLRDLLKELGLNELILLSRLGTQSVAWQILDVLVSKLPTPVSVAELRAALPELQDETFAATVIGLRRKGYVEEVQDGHSTLLRMTNDIAHIRAQEIGDYSQHVRRAAKMLFGDILTALERPGKPGHLLTISAWLPPARAARMAHELTELVKTKVQEISEDDPGSTNVRIVFGVAYDEGMS